MKKFENPMLQVVGISENDIIATSDTLVGFGSGTKSGSAACAPGERGIFDPYDPYNAEY